MRLADSWKWGISSRSPTTHRKALIPLPTLQKTLKYPPPTGKSVPLPQDNQWNRPKAAQENISTNSELGANLACRQEEENDKLVKERK